MFMQKLYNEVQNDVCKMNEKGLYIAKNELPLDIISDKDKIFVSRFWRALQKSERDERMVLGEEVVQAQIGGDQR